MRVLPMRLHAPLHATQAERRRWDLREPPACSATFESAHHVPSCVFPCAVRLHLPLHPKPHGLLQPHANARAELASLCTAGMLTRRANPPPPPAVPTPLTEKEQLPTRTPTPQRDSRMRQNQFMTRSPPLACADMNLKLRGRMCA